MIMPNYVALLLLICSTWSADTKAGHVNQKGSSFDILFGPNLFRSGAGINPQLLVTTSEPNPVTFWVAWNRVSPPTSSASNTTHTVSRGEVVAITVPLVVAINAQSPHISDLRIQLQTQGGKEVTVVAVNEQQASTDAFLAFPKIKTKSKSYEYYALSVSRGPPDVDTRSFFGIARIEPETTCSISPIADLTTARFIPIPGTSNTITLSRRISSDTNFNLTLSNTVTSVAAVSQRNGDLSGTRVVCDKPVSFITGHQCGRLPSDKTACDHMVEQVPPTETWGFQFFLVALSTRTADGYRILASTESTQCDITCTVSSLSRIIILADPGNFKEFILQSGYCSVECNRPVLIFQYSLGHENDGVSRSDPFIVIIPPVGQYSNDYDLIFFESKSLDTRGEIVVFEAWINIAVTVEYDPSGLRFDGDPLSGVSFRDVTCSNGEVCGRVAQYKPTSRTGAHTLAHTDPNAKFIATVYGWERENTYGYIGGMNFDSIAAEEFCIVNSATSAAEADGKASFVVTKTGSATDRSCISYNVSTQDYMSTSGECCFEPNEKKKTCEVQLVTDSVGEEDEVLRIELNPKPGQYVCDPPDNRTNITIQERPVQFGKIHYRVFESDRFVVLILHSSTAIRTEYSVVVSPQDGSAKAGEDYLIGVAPYTATFAPGEMTATVRIPIRDDSVLEPRESFDVLLSFPEPAASLGIRADRRNRSTVWIDDNDSLVIVFDPITYIINEHEGPAKISLKANATASFEYAVLVDTFDVSAKGGVDYAKGTYNVTFPPGSIEACLEIDITSDEIAEPAEYFIAKIRISFYTFAKGIIVEPNATAIVKIADKNRLSIIVEYSQTEYSVSESKGKAVLVLVANRSATFDYTMIVTTADVTATGDEDYSSGFYEVTFLAGETVAKLHINIINDSLTECWETFNVKLNLPDATLSQGVSKSSMDVATVAISDDDAAEIFFGPIKYNVSEEDTISNLAINLKSTKVLDFDCKLSVSTTNGTALQEYDFEGLDVSVVILPKGSDTVVVMVTILDDKLVECSEDFFIEFGISEEYSACGVSEGEDNTATVNIEDNDVSRIMFSPDEDKTVIESVGATEVCLEVEKNCIGDFQICMNTADGVETDIPAVAGEDYEAGPYCVDFAKGQIKACTQIPILNDHDINEHDHGFGVSIDVPDGVPLVPGDNITIIIEDDDRCSFGTLTLLRMQSEATQETFAGIHNNKLMVPLIPTSESLSTFKPTTFLCYQVFPISHGFINLFSTPCLSINAQFIFRTGQFYISSIGIVISGSNGQCTKVTVAGDAHDCQVTVNRLLVPSSNSSYSTGSFVVEVTSVPPRVTMVTVSSRLDHRSSVAKVKCTLNSYLETSVLDLYIPNHLRLPNSHGLLGQLWNVPATVISPECEDFVLFSSLPLYKVLLPDSRTIPVIHRTRQWDRDGSCLHASLQGPSVIEGTPADYNVSHLLATDYKYSKFSTRCM